MAGGLVAIILGSLLHAIWNVLSRSTRATPAHIVWRSLAIASLVSALLNYQLSDNRLTIASLTLVSVSAVLHVLYFCLLTDAYSEFELLSIYPFTRAVGICVTVLLGAMVIGESTSALQDCGITMICAGLLILGGARVNRTGCWRQLSPILIIGVIIALAGVVDKVGIHSAESLTAYTCTLFSLTSVIWGVLILVRSAEHINQVENSSSLLSFAWGPLVIVSYGLILSALTTLPLVIVASTREITIVFSSLLAAVFLRENIDLRTMLALSLTTIGLTTLIYTLT